MKDKKERMHSALINFNKPVDLKSNIISHPNSRQTKNRSKQIVTDFQQKEQKQILPSMTPQLVQQNINTHNHTCYSSKTDISPLIQLGLKKQHEIYFNNLSLQKKTDPSSIIHPISNQIQSNYKDLRSIRNIKTSASENTFLNSNLILEKFLFNHSMGRLCQIITEKDKNFDIRLNQMRNTTTEEIKELIQNFVKKLYSQETQIQETDKLKEGYGQPQTKININNHFSGNNGKILFYQQLNKKKITPIGNKDLKTRQIPYNFTDRTVVVIQISNLQNVWRMSSMRYCFVEVPEIEENCSPFNQQKIFEKFKQEIITKLQLSHMEICYLFFKNSNPVHEIVDIQENDKTLFVGRAPTFGGLEHIIYNDQQYVAIKNIIITLEEKLAIRTKIETPKSLIPKKVDTLQKYCIETNNDLDEINNREINLKKITKLNQFDPYFDVDVDNDINFVEYMMKVAKYIDIFFSKFDYQWRHKNDNLEHDIIIKYINKTLSIDELMETSSQRIQNINNLKQQLTDHFCKTFEDKINKKSIKEHLRKRDLHGFYILFKSLMDVCTSHMVFNDIKNLGYQAKIYNYEIDNNDVLNNEQKQRMNETQRKLREYKMKDWKAEIFSLMCDYDNIFNWSNISSILHTIASKEVYEKVNIIMMFSDLDRNGFLDEQEITDLCTSCIDLMVTEVLRIDIKKNLIKYLTGLFMACMSPNKSHQQIPMAKIKENIMKGREESDLITFFAGGLYYLNQKQFEE